MKTDRSCAGCRCNRGRHYLPHICTRRCSAPQSAKEVRGASPYMEIKNEPAPKLIVDRTLTTRGISTSRIRRQIDVRLRYVPVGPNRSVRIASPGCPACNSRADAASTNPAPPQTKLSATPPRSSSSA